MKKISLLEFRRDTKNILGQVQRGERLLLTRRGKPVARLEPIRDESVVADDPFYDICDLAEPAGSLSIPQTDKILYPG